VLLSSLSQKCLLQSPAVKVILGAMASCSSRVAPQQFVNATISVLSPQDQLDELPGPFIQAVLGLPWVFILKQGFLINLGTDRDIHEIILDMTLWSGFEKLINPMISPLVDR